MAKLKGGSTVGGKPIVTLDVMNDFIEQIQGAELESKMKKAEPDILNNFNTADTYIKNKNYNGLWQMTNGANPGTLPNSGQLLNFSNSNSRLQMYAPQNESSLYIRTGVDDTIHPWLKLATENKLNAELNKKFDKIGGDITGSITVTDNITSYKGIRVMDQDGRRGAFQSFEGNTFLLSGVGIESFDFVQPIKASRAIYVTDYAGAVGRSTAYEVWHSGNLNPKDYLPINPTSLVSSQNLNDIKTTGHYITNGNPNMPSLVTGNAYLEVLKMNNTNVLQKVTSKDGSLSYQRVLNENIWSAWKSTKGIMTFSQEYGTGVGAALTWTLVDGVYEATITHNLNSINLTSVLATDANNVSMFTGFQIVNANAIKIFSSDQGIKKIIINAI